MDITGALTAIQNSQAERATVRPWWFGQKHVMNAGVFWKSTDLDQNWDLQQHRLWPQVMRLIHSPSRALAGWGLDEDFLRDELFLLKTQAEALKPLSEIRLGASIKIAHLSDLHTCWRKHDTIAGDSIDVDVLRKLVSSLKVQNPDIVVVTGDLTDNGLGYIKLYEAFKPWIDKGAFLAVPGNHDLNRLGLSSMAAAHKNEDWADFARITMGPNTDQHFTFCSGPFLFAGLDSSGCDHSKTIADNALGQVRKADLDWLEQRLNQSDAKRTSMRFLILHHHLEVPPTKDIELGQMEHTSLKAMQLGNANRVLDFCKKNHINVVLHGHKHLPYTSASSRVTDLKIVSAPSTTIQRRYDVLTANKDQMLMRQKVDY